MITKRESVYIICTLCKRTILISKFFPDKKSDLIDIHYYHYNLVSTVPFNPYLRDKQDPLHLPRECETSIYEDYENKKQQIKEINKKQKPETKTKA